MTPDILRKKLQAVPAPIQDWFWSEEAADRVLNIKSKFQLFSEDWQVINDLIVRVEIKDLAWENFTSELIKEFDIDLPEAEKIADEIKLQLLVPIARDLAAYGIGTKEFAVIGANIPRPDMRATGSSIGPVPITTKLPSFFTSGPKPSSESSVFASSAKPVAVPTPAAPATPGSVVPPPQPFRTSVPPPAAESPAPMPVFLRQEAETSSIKTGFDLPMNFTHSSGNQMSGMDTPVPTPPRAARVELGKAPVRYDGAPEPTTRVQKETSPSQNIDYSALARSQADTIPVARPSVSDSGEITFDTPPRTAAIESLEIPLSSNSLSEEEGADASPGVLDKLMQKIAPWHYARFSGRASRSSSVLQAPEEPSKIVNYADTPPLPSNTLPSEPPKPLA